MNRTTLGPLAKAFDMLGLRNRPAATEPAIREPESGGETATHLAQAPVHVMREDGLINLVDGQLAFGVPGGRPELVRLDEISQVSLFGTAGITTPCLCALMQRGIPVIFRSAGGFYRGQAVDLSGVSSAVRRAQYRAADDPARSLALAQAFVKAKIVNQRGVMRRALPGTPALKDLAKFARDTARADDLAQLIGIEGAAAAAYYAVLPEMIAKERRAAFPWDGRRRRPPTDPLNSLLSYLYAVLAGECAAAALAAGLDPAIGFLHSEVPGRPALALDLMEPFRPLIADAVSFSAINRGEVRPEHFTKETGGSVRLTDAGRRSLVMALERRWAERAASRSSQKAQKTNWRQAVHANAHRLARALVAGDRFVSFERG